MRGEYVSALETRTRWLRWAKQSGVSVMRPFLDCLECGDTFFMNRNFCELVDHARMSIPDEIKFDAKWMQSRQGWLWIEEPFKVRKHVNEEKWKSWMAEEDRRKEQIDIRLEEEKRSVESLPLSREKVDAMHSVVEKLKGRADGITGELLELSGLYNAVKLSAIGWVQNESGSYDVLCYRDLRRLESEEEWEDGKPRKITDSEFECWAYHRLEEGKPLIETIRSLSGMVGSAARVYCEDSDDSDMSHEVRWAYAAFYLMSQRLAVSVDHQVDRHTRRRHERENMPVPPFIRVISLRRMEEERPKVRDANGELVEWNWQWEVRGHWRNQWFPSENTHKPVFVEAYIKGPQDKPLKNPGTKLFVAVR